MIAQADERVAMRKALFNKTEIARIQEKSSFASQAHLFSMMAESKRCGIDPGIPMDEMLKTRKEDGSSAKGN